MNPTIKQFLLIAFVALLIGGLASLVFRMNFVLEQQKHDHIMEIINATRTKSQVFKS